MWHGETKHGSTRGLRGFWLAALAGAALLSVACDESTTEPTAASTSAPVTIADVRESVTMTDEQAAKLQTALAELEQARQARRNARGRGEFDGPAPHLEFLAQASQFLDHEQMLALVQTLTDKREERAERGEHGRDNPGSGGFGPGHGPGHGGPGMHGPRHGGRHGRFGPGRDTLPGLIGELDLNADQKEAVQDAAKVMHETMRTLRDQVRAGTLSDAEFRAAANAAHAQFETTVAGILTAEQNTRWQQLRRERAATALTRALERMRAHQDRHLELLGQILGLDESQRAAFATIGADVLADMEALLQGVRDGSIDATQARSERQRIHDEARTAMRALLTAEQAALFDSLTRLMHRRHGPMLP